MTGEIYDVIYGSKDYESEAAKIAEIIKSHSKSGGNDVLEAACGTGNYMQFLAKTFHVDGFDLSPEQVAAAKKKLPDIRILQADMIDFDMGRQYDAILCLFSSIGYLKTKENLDKAIQNMAKHTKPGGVVIIEPWLKADAFKEGHVSLESNLQNGLAVARMGLSSKNGNISVLNMHHMVSDGHRVDHFLEVHELAMYSDEEFTDAFTKAGLEIEIDHEGLTGRGLLIGKKPSDSSSTPQP